eukprot:COSAG05_NODE_1167_length_5631_cov_3.840383_7_plen_292_part_00
MGAIKRNDMGVDIWRMDPTQPPSRARPGPLSRPLSASDPVANAGATTLMGRPRSSARPAAPLPRAVEHQPTQHSHSVMVETDSDRGSVLSVSSAGARTTRQWWMVDLDTLAHESEMPHVWLQPSVGPDPVPSFTPVPSPAPAAAGSAPAPNAAPPASAGLLKMRRAVKTVLVSQSISNNRKGAPYVWDFSHTMEQEDEDDGDEVEGEALADGTKQHPTAPVAAAAALTRVVLPRTMTCTLNSITQTPNASASSLGGRARTAVSKKKKRFQNADFDLDLVRPATTSRCSSPH